jgi:L-seryl-tRNA(Ser) seleniumtransferase
VIGRLYDSKLWLDLRCLEDETAFLANLGLPDSSSKPA